jgi:hypothetical protein
MKVYIHSCVALFALFGVFGFAAPALVSAESDAGVILGMLLCLATPPLAYLYVTKTIFKK